MVSAAHTMLFICVFVSWECAGLIKHRPVLVDNFVSWVKNRDGK